MYWYSRAYWQVIYGDAFVLMQDNARAHPAQMYMTFLDDKGISVMNWLARSPHINPIDKGISVMNWLARSPHINPIDKGISVMNWLARSPHINPIEHTWDVLSRRIRQRPHYPENITHMLQTLIEALVQELQMITQKGHKEYATSMSGLCGR